MKTFLAENLELIKTFYMFSSYNFIGKLSNFVKENNKHFYRETLLFYSRCLIFTKDLLFSSI